MRRFVDLHAHTRASDGVLAPAELVRLAEGKRLAALAVTDHDTTEGLPEAAAAARGLPLRLIAGVEVSAPGARGRRRCTSWGWASGQARAPWT